MAASPSITSSTASPNRAGGWRSTSAPRDLQRASLSYLNRRRADAGEFACGGCRQSRTSHRARSIPGLAGIHQVEPADSAVSRRGIPIRLFVEAVNHLKVRRRGGVLLREGRVCLPAQTQRASGILYAFDLLELNGTDPAGSRSRCGRRRLPASYGRVAMACGSMSTLRVRRKRSRIWRSSEVRPNIVSPSSKSIASAAMAPDHSAEPTRFSVW